jgi:BirA family biotin operon repressor/biotin-[acetyl-CoA-carboxylase] ligase
MEQLPFVSIIGSLATARAVRKVAGVDPAIKWPNDIMLNGRKAAGILAESAVEGDSVCYAVLGIGINVALNPSDDDEISAIAISVNEAAGTEVARESLLRQLLLELDDLYRRLRTGGSDAGRSPIEEWSGLLETIGNTVTATFRNESISGDAIGVDSAGNLLLRTETGETITLTAGDVTLSAHLRQSRSGSHST